MSKTLVIIKPDAMNKKIVGKIITIFEKNDLHIKNIKIMHFKKEKIEKFYEEHKNKIFFDELINFMMERPVIIILLEGNNAIEKTRKLMGTTNYRFANKKTIRGKWASSLTKNVIHGSDSKISVMKEINLLFEDD